MVRWIMFYESLYELDDVERPNEDVINDDDKCDAWFDNYKTYMNQQLREYHKNRKTPTADRGIPRPLISMGNPND